MKNALFTLFFAALLLLACNDAPKSSAAEQTTEIVHLTASGPKAKTSANIQIDGMMCEIACGGKIKKELYELEGVSKAEIAYHDGDEADFAVVEYDPEVLSESELIASITSIADGELYAVPKMEVTQFTPVMSNGDNVSASDEANMSVGFRIPGILELLKSFMP
jgi:copper chaperone CopZ